MQLVERKHKIEIGVSTCMLHNDFLWSVWSKGISHCKRSCFSEDGSWSVRQRVRPPNPFGISAQVMNPALVRARRAAVLPCGLSSLWVLASSKALCPHSSSLSFLSLSSSFSLLSFPSQDTLWGGLCSEWCVDEEGRLGATLHTAIPLLLATPRTPDFSGRKLLICRDRSKHENDLRLHVGTLNADKKA